MSWPLRLHRSAIVSAALVASMVCPALVRAQPPREVPIPQPTPAPPQDDAVASASEAATPPITAQVVVRAAPSSPGRQPAGLGRIVEQPVAVALPLVGRGFVPLIGLAPGVALPPGSAFPRINGGRPRANEYLVDGVSVLQPEPGQVAIVPGIETVHEMRVETNSPAAEFGRFNGGVVSIVTRSGTNRAEGTLFNFMRHEALAARPVFTTPGDARPQHRRQQRGGVVGGPLRRDRLFAFADYQAQRQSIGRTVISTVPTRLQREGIFTEPMAGRVPAIFDPATTGPLPGSGTGRLPFAGGIIPRDRIDPVAAALLQRYPLPTGDGTANNFQRSGIEQADQDQGGLRLDLMGHQGAQRLFGRLTMVRERVRPVLPLADGSGATGGTPGPQQTRVSALALGAHRAWSSGLLAEVRVGDTRRAVDRQAAAADGLSLLPPAVLASPLARTTLPAVVIAGYQQLGSPASTATDMATGVTQITGSVTRLWGTHLVKAGADLRWSRLDILQPPLPAGQFTFSALFTDQPGVGGSGHPLASFLLGQVERYAIDLQADTIHNRAHVQEYFAQDEWRLREGTTLHAGLRYTLNFPSTERRNQAAAFNLETQQIEFAGRDGQPRSLRRLHLHNVGPRVNLTQRLGAQARVRGGYALIWIDMTGITTPFTTPAFPFLQSVGQRSLDGVTPAFVLASGPSVAPLPLTPAAGLGQGVFAVDRDQGSGYAQQWHAGAERDLPHALTARLAYVGSTVTRLGVPDANLNQLTTEQLALGPSLQQRVPNPFFGQIPRSSSLGDSTIPLAQLLKPFPMYTTVSLYRQNIGRSTYHGLTASLDRRWRDGLSATVSYTWSRLTDDASSVFDASILTGPLSVAPVADVYNRRLDRDVSAGDMPHVLVASGVWAVPVGRGRRHRWPGWRGWIGHDWTVSGVLTLQSGLPVAVTQATNLNAFAGFSVQRPNLVGDPALPAGQRTAARWFRTEAFALAPAFTLGSASRHPVRGPGVRLLDLAVVREVALGNRGRLDLRGEVFNALNAPAYGAPNGVFGSAAFGSITTAGDPRVVQLAVRLHF